jgi:uncharacterized membrane protein YgcG
MIKRAAIVTVLLPGVVWAAVPALTPNLQVAPEQSRSAAVAGTPAIGVFEQLSMGPDPGGHTGAKVTPETSKTGQPSQDGGGGSSQSGATSSGATGSSAAKQPSDGNNAQSGDTPPKSPTAGQSQSGKER